MAESTRGRNGDAQAPPEPCETIYAVCPECAHVEPRPAHTEYDWFPCESCGEAGPVLFREPHDAEEASQAALDGFEL